jgi:hypothetical protein
MLSELRLNRTERVLVQPVSLHDVRSEIELALGCRSATRSTSEPEPER